MDTTLKKTAERSGHEQVSARLTSQEVGAIDQLVDAGFFLNRSDFLRTAARDKLQAVEVLEIRDVDRQQALKEILRYMAQHPGSYPSDIARELELDLRLVMELCRQLLDADRLEEEA